MDNSPIGAIIVSEIGAKYSNNKTVPMIPVLHAIECHSSHTLDKQNYVVNLEQIYIFYYLGRVIYSLLCRLAPADCRWLTTWAW